MAVTRKLRTWSRLLQLSVLDEEVIVPKGKGLKPKNSKVKICTPARHFSGGPAHQVVKSVGLTTIAVQFVLCQGLSPSALLELSPLSRVMGASGSKLIILCTPFATFPLSSAVVRAARSEDLPKIENCLYVHSETTSPPQGFHLNTSNPRSLFPVSLFPVESLS